MGNQVIQVIIQQRATDLPLLLPSSTVTTIAAFLCSHNRLVPLEVWSCYANEKFGVIFNHYTHASLLAVGA